ncbi:MAG: hemerythrin domain-containing protein [Rhodocyclales bacterium]|nr:hemerythrin domain-containing protein [Rhodocyclales bacterium]
MIEAFLWSERFDTGIDIVDHQHRHLVDLVNRVGSHLAENSALDEAEQQELFKQLAAYARGHFADEELLMRTAGIDARHVDQHVRRHQEFVAQVVTMWRARATMPRPAETLHGFLASWLTYHILGEDQQMAHELHHVASGIAPAAAHQMEMTQRDPSTIALLSAMETLYAVLGERNSELEATNQELEARVSARTTSLAEANARLSQEQNELRALLSKIEQVQTQLRQSEKMSAIGQLAAGVAHEINNPIGFVSSNLGTLTGYVKDLLRVIAAGQGYGPLDALAAELDLDYLRKDIEDLLAESMGGLDRVRKIVANLKDFSHVDEAEFQEADLLVGLESTVQVVWHELKYKVDLHRELTPLPAVQCIPAQINQVLMNLLVNAAQAIPDHGVVTLRSGVGSAGVWIEIEDSGCGMPPEVQQRIFEPFFTTKPVGKGTGLGLSLSYDIVTKHGGSFDVASTPGAGTRIRINLPLTRPQP